jgi:16S rRNA processing protein RimM
MLKLTTNKDLLEVGRIGKSRGLKGEVVVTLTTDRTERVARGAKLVANERVLSVASSREHQGKYLVCFDGVDSPEAAKTLTGTVLYAEPLNEPDTMWIHQLIGKRVVDQRGVDRGVVKTVVANPASDLLELESGALVPLTFVVAHKDDIHVDVPDGLFE